LAQISAHFQPPEHRRERLVVEAVDYHTAGEPFRIVTGGAGPIPGRTMLEKRRFAQERLDWLRRLLVYEPRGHADMYGGLIVDPVAPDSDLGVLFFHNDGFSTACGHGTIALATWALETGALGPKERFRIDVPSGTLEVRASFHDGRVDRVAFVNVPSFVLLEGLPAGRVTADIAFGGAFYASVDALQAGGVAIEPASVPRFIELGREIKQALDEAHEIQHPLEPELRGVYGVIFWQREGGVDPLRQRNVTVFANGEVDRSPCGSGTSARLAILDRTGELPRGRTLVHSSVIGTEFEARVTSETTVGPHSAVITEVAGSACVTGFHEFVLEPWDPLGEGFLMR
jgi:proline racemase